MKPRQSLRFFVPSIGFLCISAGSALGQTSNFSSYAPSSSWFDSGNWSSGIPNSSVTGYIYAGSTIYFGDFKSGATTILGGAATAQSLILQTSPTLDLGSNFAGGKSGSLNISGNLGAQGNLVIQNGTVTVGGAVLGNPTNSASYISIGSLSGGGAATLTTTGNVRGNITVQHGSTLNAGSLGNGISSGYAANVQNYGTITMAGDQLVQYGSITTEAGGKTQINGNLTFGANFTEQPQIRGAGGDTHITGNLVTNHNANLDSDQGATLEVDGTANLTESFNYLAGTETFANGVVFNGGTNTIGGTINGNVQFLNAPAITFPSTTMGATKTTINGNVENAMALTLENGNDGSSTAGQTKINGNLTLDPTSQLIVNLGGTPNTWTPMQVTGSASLNGALGMEETKSGVYTVDILHSQGVITGMFDMNLSEDASEIKNIVYTQHDVYVTFTGTPEPAPAAFLGLGVGFLALNRRRASKRK